MESLFIAVQPKIYCRTSYSYSVQESILNCIQSHKAYWSCLRVHKEYNLNDLNNVNPQPDLHKVIKKFIGADEPLPERFPTRNCYPLQDHQELAQLSERLRKLRFATNLSFAAQRVCYVYDAQMTEHRNNYEE